MKVRVRRLAELRSAEGYLAEAVTDGQDMLLLEHHCPICDAASTCQGLCRAELDLFRETLGDDVTVERTQHVLSGDLRCAYRISPRDDAEAPTLVAQLSAYSSSPRRRRAAVRTTVASSRRVGVWAARKRATPTRMSAASSDPSGQAMRLADAGLDDLEPVEAGVLLDQRVAQSGDQGLAARRRRAGSRRRGCPASSTAALHVPAGGEVGQRRPWSACGRRAAGTLRKRSR